MSSQPKAAGDHGHPAGGGRGLGHRVVDGDLGQRRPDLVERRGVGGDAAQGGGEARVLLGQEVEEHTGSYDEHAGVPAVARVDVRRSDLGGGLLDELPDREGARRTVEGVADVDVAEAGRGVGGLDADRHQPARAGGLDRGGRGRAEGVGAVDDVVRGEGAHDGIRVAHLEEGGGQADRGHRVARGRLGDHGVGAQLGQLRDDGVAVRLAGDDEDPVVGQRGQPVVRRLDQGATAAGQVVQELGRALPRQRPEAGAGAAGGDHGPEVI